MILGAIHIGLGVVVIYDGIGRGEPCIPYFPLVGLLNAVQLYLLPIFLWTLSGSVSTIRASPSGSLSRFPLLSSVGPDSLAEPGLHLQYHSRRHDRTRFNGDPNLKIRQTLPSLFDASCCHHRRHPLFLHDILLPPVAYCNNGDSQGMYYLEFVLIISMPARD